MITIILLPLSQSVEQDMSTDVLIDISKELDVKYGNPEVQAESFLGLLDENNVSYEFTENGQALDGLELKDYKLLILWDPDESYQPEELEAVHEYVKGGGTLLYAGNSYSNTSADVFDNINEMLSAYGITLVREMMIDTTDYVGCHCGTTPVLSDFIAEEYLYNVSALAASHTMRFEYEDPAYAIAWGDDDAFIDSDGDEMHDDNEMIGHIPVIVKSHYGKGTVIAFGTEKMFENAYILREENEIFAVNIVMDTISDYTKEAGGGFPAYIIPVLVLVCAALVAGGYFISRRR